MATGMGCHGAGFGEGLGLVVGFWRSEGLGLVVGFRCLEASRPGTPRPWKRVDS